MVDEADLANPDGFEVKLNSAFLRHRWPGVRWWNWGDLEGDLKGKVLGDRTDPSLNSMDRETERKKLPDNLVLPYAAWEDFEDEEGNEFVWLEVEFDETSMGVKVVEAEP